MDINQKVAKIPFLILYGVTALFHIFSSIAIYISVDLETAYAFHKDQPWDHFLASTASRLFGIGYNDYFLFSIPVYLLFFYGVIKLGGWLIKTTSKETEIKGDNHMAIICILFLLPKVLYEFGYFILGMQPIRGWGVKLAATLGFILIIIFSILTEAADRKAKKRKSEAKAS